MTSAIDGIGHVVHARRETAIPLFERIVWPLAGAWLGLVAAVTLAVTLIFMEPIHM